MVHDVLVIGSGPAGLTAGIYLGRFKHDVLIIDGNQPGGQLMATGEVENWPGDLTISGPELMKQMREQAQKCGAQFLADTVVSVDFSSSPFTVKTKHGKTVQARAVIIATGSSPRRMGVQGEDAYWGKGVTSCATCDAPLYKDRNVVVVGGGNSAIAEADALSKFAKQVTVVQLHDKLTATDPLTDKVLAMSNVDVLYGKKVVEVKGDGERVTSVMLEDQSDLSEPDLSEPDLSVSEVSADGVFIAIGMIPNSKPFRDVLDVDDCGYIVPKDGHATSTPGVFVAGDVADRMYRQAITAAGMGCGAALECDRWLKG